MAVPQPTRLSHQQCPASYTARFTAEGALEPPYTGTPVSVPGVLELENFDNGAAGVAYEDTSAGNSGGEYRSTDVDITATEDSGGGYVVGWSEAGEWLAYSATVAAAGSYDLEFRVASAGPGGTFHLEVNGEDVTGAITVPDTGDWQAWRTIGRQAVNLPAGPQVWRVVMDSVGATGAVGNFNWLHVVSSASSWRACCQVSFRPRTSISVGRTWPMRTRHRGTPAVSTAPAMMSTSRSPQMPVTATRSDGRCLVSG